MEIVCEEWKVGDECDHRWWNACGGKNKDGDFF